MMMTMTTTTTTMMMMMMIITMESFGPLGSKATSFLSELYDGRERRITVATYDVQETSYLYQRIFVHSITEIQCMSI